jgi:PmbA protein
MLGETKLKDLTGKVLSASSADQTEVVIISGEQNLTRFANNEIHQNVNETNAQVRVRAVVGQRFGVTSGNDISDEGLRRLVQKAVEVTKLSPENPDFKGLPGPTEALDSRWRYTAVTGFDEATANATPDTRARGVREICRQALAARLVAAGKFETGASELVVANSLGTLAYYPYTEAGITTVIMGEDSSGYAARLAWRMGDLDATALGAEALDKASRGRNPKPLEPGDYPVVLEEYAVADLIEMLAYMGLGALSVQEERSFMAGKFGQRIMHPSVSIWDNGLDPAGNPMPFDYEGVPKQRVDLIQAGVAKAVVYDSYTAGREEGAANTGHALPAPNTFGPFPSNLFMAPGDSPRQQLVENLERGLWITRFWYTRPVHRRQTIVTGMTRDGTFLIEGGQVIRPIRQLRFTQSYVEALNTVEAISRETRLVPGQLGGGSMAYRVPALRLGQFAFTSATQF